jgi:hypothetical protein
MEGRSGRSADGTGPRRKLINALAIRYLLPVVYGDRSFAVEVGLLSYGTDVLYMFRSHPAWREAWRSAGSVSDQVHPLRESHHRTSDRAEDSVFARAR